MAATKRNAMLIEEAREKIKTTQLINRLQNHALGSVEMSPTQVRATEILLRKRIPDLTATTAEIKVNKDLADLTTNELLSALASHGIVGSQESSSKLN